MINKRKKDNNLQQEKIKDPNFKIIFFFLPINFKKKLKTLIITYIFFFKYKIN